MTATPSINAPPVGAARTGNGRTARVGIAVLLACALLGMAGYRVVTMMQAEAALGRGDVAGALRWRPQHPEALMGLATQRLAAGDPDGAVAAATHLLQQEPAEGRGYRVLAQAALARQQPERARALFRIAARRAPRDLITRAWLAQDALERGDAVQAMEQIDHVLRLSPGTAASLFPVMVPLSGDPAFADALAQTLRTRPEWRHGFLAALRNPVSGNPANADVVLSALQRRGGLDQDETDAWIESLLAAGRWGEAYARWAAPLVERGHALPLLFNGDLASPASGKGYDWRIPQVAGVIVDVEGAQGDRSLRLRYLGRRVAGTQLEHALLLAPGAYQFQFRHRLDSLRSDNGLQWTLTCASAHGQPQVLARSTPLSGSRPWQQEQVAFQVPANDCAGQWLRFGNAGAAQLVSGELWIGALSIRGAGRP